MITFNAETHEYFNGDQKLISVTQLMRKHGLAPNYDGVPSEVLKRAAERGTLVHQEIENAIKKGEVGFTAEVFSFIQYMALKAKTDKKVNVFESEYILYNDIVAGTADLILIENGEYIIADIKTTQTLHKEAVSWQLSIYAQLFNEMTNGEIEIKRGQVFHFDKEGALNVVEMPLKPVLEVERLLDCERNGETYQEKAVIVSFENDAIAELVEIEKVIKRIEEQKKEAEAQAYKLRGYIIKAMQEGEIKSYENDRIKLNYVEPTTRTAIDSARLKAEMPEIAEKYTKTSQVKASLRITLKGDKE
jgi:predicted phage-related endonuclease